MTPKKRKSAMMNCTAQWSWQLRQIILLENLPYIQICCSILASENILSVTKDITQISKENLKLKQLIFYHTTFLLGDFYVSIVVARNIYFQGDPIFPVAFLIHDKKFRKYHQEFLTDIFEAAGLA